MTQKILTADEKKFSLLAPRIEANDPTLTQEEIDWFAGYTPPPASPGDNPPPPDPGQPAPPTEPERKQVTKTGKIVSTITPELTKLQGCGVALLGEVGPAIIFGPDFYLVFKTNSACDNYIARGASVAYDTVVDPDVVSNSIILTASLLG